MCFNYIAICIFVSIFVIVNCSIVSCFKSFESISLKSNCGFSSFRAESFASLYPDLMQLLYSLSKKRNTCNLVKSRKQSKTKITNYVAEDVLINYFSSAEL